MKTVALVLTIIFSIISIIELIFCYLEKEKERKILKVFCVGVLSIVMILLVPNHPLIYCGLLFGTLGDLLLLFKKDHIFVLGAGCFLIGHIFYFSEIFVNFIGSFIPYWFYIIFVLSIVVVAILMVFPLSKISRKKEIVIGGAIYFTILLSALVLSITTICYLPNTYLFFVLIGYIFFIISDAFLVITKFKVEVKHRQFYIMSTYLLAEFFISLGFLLTIGF